MASHPAARLAVRRYAPGAAEELAASAAQGPGACGSAGLGDARPRRHDGRATTGDGHNCCSHNHGRRQHGRRRLLADGGLGALRTGGGRHAGPGSACRQALRTPSEERAALGNSADALGDTTFDIHLNDRAYWRNVPSSVWHYKLGGYQVLKKWLSYRERGVLGRALRPEEVQHFTDTARRIAGILRLMGVG